jgi:hypothetical protein
MVVQPWKWFIGLADGFGIVAQPIDVPLVSGLVWVKLTTQEEEEEDDDEEEEEDDDDEEEEGGGGGGGGLALGSASFSHLILLSIYTLIHQCSLLASLT